MRATSIYFGLLVVVRIYSSLSDEKHRLHQLFIGDQEYIDVLVPIRNNGSLDQDFGLLPSSSIILKKRHTNSAAIIDQIWLDSTVHASVASAAICGRWRLSLWPINTLADPVLEESDQNEEYYNLDGEIWGPCYDLAQVIHQALMPSLERNGVLSERYRLEETEISFSNSSACTKELLPGLSGELPGSGMHVAGGGDFEEEDLTDLYADDASDKLWQWGNNFGARNCPNGEELLKCANHLVWTKQLWDAYRLLGRAARRCATPALPSHALTLLAAVAPAYARYALPGGLPHAAIRQLDPVDLKEGRAPPWVPRRPLPGTPIDGSGGQETAEGSAAPLPFDPWVAVALAVALAHDEGSDGDSNGSSGGGESGDGGGNAGVPAGRGGALRPHHHSPAFLHRAGKELGAELAGRPGAAAKAAAWAAWGAANRAAAAARDAAAPAGAAGRARHRHALFLRAQQTALFPLSASAEWVSVKNDIAVEASSNPLPFTPIFVVGMPRSGSSLIEKVLSTHSEVAGAGETPCLPAAAPDVYPGEPPAAQRRRLARALLGGDGANSNSSSLRAEYISCILGHLLPQGRKDLKDENIKYILDKNLYNYRLLGFASLLFPEAVFIHCTRHPLDVTLSIYSIFFSKQVGLQWFQHDIGEILEYYTQYQELMMHWNQLQTSTDVIGNILEVPYEHMATHFEQSLANLLYHLRLDFEPELLNFHSTNIGHTIDTASHWQVAVPVYNGSVSRWKMFEKQLKLELEGTTFEHFLTE